MLRERFKPKWREPLIVADAGGGMVAMAHAVDDLVAAIHVEPAFKRRGVGTTLMGAVEDQILDRFGAARLEGRFCPHCGSFKSWRIEGPSARHGLYETEIGCRSPF